tara:strand:+ start:387 stop:749 length:363 start_codon:yes stop_codon:yes gene_type:complete
MIKNINASECFEILKQNKNAKLIDVRTKAEWENDGYADLTLAKKELYFISWSGYDDQFINEIEKLNLNDGEILFFICRSGVRSIHAIKSLLNKFPSDSLFNVDGGMEQGWRLNKLPIKVC